MKKWCLLFSLGAVLALAAGAAHGEDIRGRLGVTGRLGFAAPADSDVFGFNVSADPGFTGGGGLIFGVTDTIALEADVSHADYDSGFGFTTTDISFGAQYRFVNLPVQHLVPFVGGGLSVLINGADNGLDVDTVVGAHAKGGVDYFLTRDLAATAELKWAIAPNADIRDFRGVKIGNFDPINFSTMVGMRYFF